MPLYFRARIRSTLKCPVTSAEAGKSFAPVIIHLVNSDAMTVGIRELENLFSLFFAVFFRHVSKAQLTHSMSLGMK